MRFQTAAILTLASFAVAQEASESQPEVSVPNPTEAVPSLTSGAAEDLSSVISTLPPTVSDEVTNLTSSVGEIISSAGNATNGTAKPTLSETVIQATTTDDQGNTITTEMTSTKVIKPTGGDSTATDADGAGGTNAAVAPGANVVLGGLLGAAGLLAAL